MINWFKIDLPYESDKEADMFITLTDKIEKDYNFSEKLPMDMSEPAAHIHYSRSHNMMLIGT